MNDSQLLERGVSSEGLPLELCSDLNTFVIEVGDQDSQGGNVDFKDVQLTSVDGAEQLGDFPGNDGFQVWTVTEVDLSQGFTISGRIELSGSFSGSQEAAKVEMKVGCNPATITVVPVPMGLLLLFSGLLGFAAVCNCRK